MKVLLVNGSPHEKGCTYTSLREVADALEQNGIGTEIHWIGNGEIPGCKACGCCKKTGRCVINDDINAIGDRIGEFDGFVFGSPVYYSGPAGQLCAWMDRFFYTYAGKLRGKVGACVVNARRGGNSASFERLNQYFLISSMVVPGSQYWNMTHGNTVEEVVKDAEGLQTMRTLGRNIAWILKCIDAGKKAGVELPEPEPRARTDFIRD
ncbi:MAG: flavodoxin family protein [Candidatus Methanomethylophilus sp.]|nr:flavodoxin family protein [Methanomethylophilus sp.]